MEIKTGLQMQSPRQVEQAGVEYVASLSSVDADKAEGTGPVAGLHYLEQTLNRIPALNALHLRPGYFMENNTRADRNYSNNGCDLLIPQN